MDSQSRIDLSEKWLAMAGEHWNHLFLQRRDLSSDAELRWMLTRDAQRKQIRELSHQLSEHAEALGINSSPLDTLTGNFDAATEEKWDTAWELVKRLSRSNTGNSRLAAIIQTAKDQTENREGSRTTPIHWLALKKHAEDCREKNQAVSRQEIAKEYQKKHAPTMKVERIVNALENYTL